MGGRGGGETNPDFVVGLGDGKGGDRFGVERGNDTESVQAAQSVPPITLDLDKPTFRKASLHFVKR